MTLQSMSFPLAVPNRASDGGIDFSLQSPEFYTRRGGLPYEEYMGVCHELGSHFQEKIPKRVCQFFTKIPERAIISVRNSI